MVYITDNHLFTQPLQINASSGNSYLRHDYDGSHHGTIESADRNFESGTFVAIAEFSCCHHHDILFIISIYYVQRHRCDYCWQEKSGADAIHDENQQINTIYFGNMFGNRHNNRRDMGKNRVGQILGLGPERSLGADNISRQCAKPSSQIAADILQAAFHPHLHDISIFMRVIYLFWCQLHFGRTTQLRINHPKRLHFAHFHYKCFS